MPRAVCDLQAVLNLTQPLGPIQQEHMEDSCAEKLLDHQVAPFREIAADPHMLLLGRKGAGKTAALAEIRIAASRRGDVRRSRPLPRRGAQFVLAIDSWPHFHEVVSRVGRNVQGEQISPELIPPERYTELWVDSLWHEIITYFYDYAHEDDTRAALEALHAYINADAPPGVPLELAARQMAKDARDAIVTFLDDRDAQLFFLVDTMERYPIRNSVFAQTLSGMFPAMYKIKASNSRIKITFSVPEEIESFMAAGSANLMKDFASSFRVRWKPIDLVQLIAYRLRASASIHDKPLYEKTKNLNFADRNDLHEMLSAILPGTIRNVCGSEEDALAYIIRHTQLLPRQILFIFNAALSEQFRKYKSFENISGELVRKAVTESQRFIGEHILTLYRNVYPKLLFEAKKILPDLEPICDYQSLRKVESRFDRNIEDDVVSIWDTMFEMGILGRSTRKEGDLSNPPKGENRYCYGQFYFNANSGFGLATDGEYCFHPIFARYYGMARRKEEQRVVYPANIDLENIYADQGSG